MHIQQRNLSFLKNSKSSQVNVDRRRLPLASMSVSFMKHYYNLSIILNAILRASDEELVSVMTRNRSIQCRSKISET